MNALITGATVLDESSEYYGKTVDIRIKGTQIEEIGSSIIPKKGEEQITQSGLLVSPGWFDTSVSMGEPGFEDRETLKNGLKVAAKGGFTGVAVNANTSPIIDSNADVSFLKNKAAGNAVNLYPIGALSRNSEGIDLAELYDMNQAGAVAFGDYQQPISNPNLLKLALQYVQGFDGLVLSFPLDRSIAGKGIVNEGNVSTHLGLKGIPPLAESLQVARDLYILEYTGGRLHIPTISTEASVNLIREAKSKGLDVSCSVSIAHLHFTDESLTDFDTNFKLLPPLRDEKNRQALIEGVKDGTIDMVCSDHNPLDVEKKKLEFDYAHYGTVAQEATFGILLQIVSEKKAVKLLTAGRKRFVGESLTISKGNKADLTLFTTKGSQVSDSKTLASKSKNNAFEGNTLKGKVLGIFANGQYIEN